MSIPAVLIFLGLVIVYSWVSAARKVSGDQRRPTQPGPVAPPPFGGGLDPGRRSQRPGFPQQAPRTDSPGVPWRPSGSPQSPQAKEPPTFRPGPRPAPVETRERPWSGEGQNDLSREVVDEETAAMEAETANTLFEASTIGRDADRMGRDAEERSGATSIRDEADGLGTLAGTKVAARAGAAQAQPLSPTLVGLLRGESLGRAVVLSEVLGPPKALARRTAVAGVRRPGR